MRQLSGISNHSSNPLRRFAAYILTASLIALALMFSLVMLAVLIVIGLLALAYVALRTRGLRKNMRGQPLDAGVFDTAEKYGAAKQGDGMQGVVIEGEATRVVDPQANSKGQATLVT